MTVGALLTLIEHGKSIPITAKMVKYFFIPMFNTFYSKAEQKKFREARKNDENYKKSKGYIVIPARKFWTRAVKAFQQRLKQRKNVVIDDSKKYKLKILVKN